MTSTSNTSLQSFQHSLFSSLKGNGTLDTLKVRAQPLSASPPHRSTPSNLRRAHPVVQTQVRSRLLDEVKRQGLVHPPRSVREASLEQRAADCLILDHLLRAGYGYSVSIFMPESAQTEAKLSVEDAFRALGAPAHLRQTSADAKESSLVRALVAVGEKVAERQDMGAQTDMAADAPGLEHRLQRVDERLIAAEKGGAPKTAVEENMLRFQREVEARSAAQLQNEVRRLREVELHPS